MKFACCALFLFSLGLSSCELGKSCTEIGCIDGATLTLRTADGTWPDGAYTLTLGVEGTTHTCSMSVPEDLPPLGSVMQLTCQPGLGFPGASLQQDAVCQEQQSGDAISQSCTPVPDQYTLTMGVQGTPATLAVSVTREGSTLIEQNVSLAYTEFQPNGEGCEPVCRQASAALTLE